MAKSSELFDYVKITDLEVSKGVINKLEEFGIETIGDLKLKTPNELKSIKGIGTTALVAIREALINQYGYRLAKNPPKPKKAKSAPLDPYYKENLEKVRNHLFLGIRYEKNIGVEYSIAAGLLKKYDFDTLMSVKPNEKANHPAFYLSKWGIEYILKNAQHKEEKVFTTIIKKDKVVEPEPELEEESPNQPEIVYEKTIEPLKSLKDYLKF